MSTPAYRIGNDTAAAPDQRLSDSERFVLFTNTGGTPFGQPFQPDNRQYIGCRKLKLNRADVDAAPRTIVPRSRLVSGSSAFADDVGRS
jgi:hypothetical protein